MLRGALALAMLLAACQFDAAGVEPGSDAIGTECALDTDRCDPAAACIPERNGYRCECPEELTRDGALRCWGDLPVRIGGDTDWVDLGSQRQRAAGQAAVGARAGQDRGPTRVSP